MPDAGALKCNRVQWLHFGARIMTVLVVHCSTRHTRLTGTTASPEKTREHRANQNTTAPGMYAKERIPNIMGQAVAGHAVRMLTIVQQRAHHSKTRHINDCR
jgi:hypothetical protein